MKKAMRYTALACLTIMAIPTCAVAADAVTTAVTVATSSDASFWLTVIKGAGLGVVATLVGWLKNSNPGLFDYRGLILKVPVGFVVGAIAAWKGIEFATAYDWATGIGVVSIVDQVIKLIVRRIAPSFSWEVLNTEDVAATAAANPTTQATIR